MLFDSPYNEFFVDRENSYELKDVAAAVEGFNFEFGEEMSQFAETSFLHELLADDSFVPFPSAMSNSEDWSEMSGEEVLQALCQYQPPTSSECFPELPPILPPSVDQSMQQSALPASEPLLKSSLLDEEPITFLHNAGWMPVSAPPVSQLGATLLPQPMETKTDMFQSPLPQSSLSAPSSMLNRKRKGGPNGKSEEELKNLPPTQVKRILSNRASAARSKNRRKKHTESLKEQSKALTERNNDLRLQIQDLECILQEDARDIQERKQRLTDLHERVAALSISNRELERKCRSAAPLEGIPEAWIDSMDSLISDFLHPHPMPFTHSPIYLPTSAAVV